jgi:hypothetical protein
MNGVWTNWCDQPFSLNLIKILVLYKLLMGSWSEIGAFIVNKV